MRAGTAALALLAGACDRLSTDGRFCCPSWCDGECGGATGLCSTSALEEVGMHACGAFAPPCLVDASSRPAPPAELPSDAEMQRAHDAAQAAAGAAQAATAAAPPREPQPLLRRKPVPQEVAALAPPESPVELVKTLGVDSDVEVRRAARASMELVMEQRVREIDQLIDAKVGELKHIEAQVHTLEQAAQPAGVQAANGSLAALIKAAPLPAVAIPELARVEKVEESIQDVEKAWDAANATEASRGEKASFKGAALSVKRAARDRELLDESLVALGKQLQQVEEVATKVHEDAHLSDISPQLLRDLHRLRDKGAFLQTAQTRSGSDDLGWAAQAAELREDAVKRALQAEMQLRAGLRQLAALRLERAAWAQQLSDMQAQEKLQQVEEQTEERASMQQASKKAHADARLAAAAGQLQRQAQQGSLDARADSEELGELVDRATKVHDVLAKANATVGLNLATASTQVRAGIRELAGASRELEDVQDAGTLGSGSAAAEKQLFASLLRELDRRVTTARQRTLALRADEESLLGRAAQLDGEQKKVSDAAQTAGGAVAVLDQAAAKLDSARLELQREAADAREDQIALR